ncbi:MAG: hypothetical protein EP330_22650 [Deltaproteobacteria bacterium]|nr:MAG: hypothetical protein EP330_22650 [Deltaproteobacteria bacterium]
MTAALVLGFSMLFFPIRGDGTHNDLGEGTASNPYRIGSARAFADLGRYGCGETSSQDCDAHFVLTAHLDLSGSNLVAIGTPENPFTGELDGQGYSLYAATVTDWDIGAHTGLFGTLERAEVHSLLVNFGSMHASYAAGVIAGECFDSRIHDVDVRNSDARGDVYAGGLVAVAEGCELYKNDVEAEVRANTVGGLVSRITDSDVYRNTMRGEAYGYYGAAGLAYDSRDSFFMNNAVIGTVNGAQVSAGLVGNVARQSWIIHNLVAAPILRGSRSRGGAVGTAYALYEAVGNYFSIAVTGVSALNDAEIPPDDYDAWGVATDADPGIYPTSDASMRLRSTYVDWDFGGAWAHSRGFYPRVL